MTKDIRLHDLAMLSKRMLSPHLFTAAYLMLPKVMDACYCLLNKLFCMLKAIMNFVLFEG